MLREQLSKEDNRNELQSFKILDDELIGLLSGKFNADDYPSDFNFDKVEKSGKKIEELEPIKIEEIELIDANLEVIEPSFDRIKAKKEKTEIIDANLEVIESSFDHIKAKKEKAKRSESDFHSFQLEQEEINLIKQRPKTQHIKLIQPSRPLKGTQISNTPENRDDLGYMELDLIPHSYISKEVKLIKSLADKLVPEYKSSKKEIAPSEDIAENSSHLPKIKSEKLKIEDNFLPDAEEKPKYTKPKKVQTKPKPVVEPEEENKSLLAGFQYENTEECALGIPFEAFDLSDFKLEDIISDHENSSDDILNDEDLLRELYGNEIIGQYENANSAKIMKGVDTIIDTKPKQTTTDDLPKGVAIPGSEKIVSDKLSRGFKQRLDAIIKKTVAQTIEDSLHDLLPEIIGKIIHKKNK